MVDAVIGFYRGNVCVLVLFICTLQSSNFLDDVLHVTGADAAGVFIVGSGLRSWTSRRVLESIPAKKE